MVETETAEHSGAPLDDERVADYLRKHPDFLIRQPQLLETLELQHNASGPAISLIERQVEVLRGRGQRLENRLEQLVQAARDNERRATSVHRLARTLIRAPTLGNAVLGLMSCMREEFNIDAVFVGLFSPYYRRTDIDGIVRLDPEGPIARDMGNLLRTKLIECGPLNDTRSQMLFPKAKPEIRSAALVPLEKERNLGVLVLGSPDPERFQPRQGKLFLEMTAELLSAAVRAKLG